MARRLIQSCQQAADEDQGPGKRDRLFVQGQRPRPMYVDYKDLELLKKLTIRQADHQPAKERLHGGQPHAVTWPSEQSRFMALLPYTGK